MNYALFYPTSANQQHLLFIFYFLPFFLGNFSVSLPRILSLSICRGKGQKQWEEFFLLFLLPLVCLPPFLVLNSLSSLLSHFGMNVSFLVLQGTVLILHSRKWENTTGQGVLWEWVTIVPSGFICLLYKSPCCPQKCQAPDKWDSEVSHFYPRNAE